MNAPGSDRNLRVLFVCTANVCRSPLGAGLLKLRATQASAPISIASAGTLAEGMSTDPNVVTVLQEYGVDATAKKSRLLTPELIRASDIVLTMTREHVRDLAIDMPEAFRRTFPVKEFLRRASETGRPQEGQSIADWLEKLGEGRTASSYLGDLSADGVRDPIGGSMAEFRTTADELELLFGNVAQLLV